MQALLGEYWFDQPDEASKRVSNLLAGALPKGELDDGLRGKLARSARLMPEVAEVELRDDLFRRVQIHRNNADYGFLLSVCRLLSGRMFSEGRPGVVRFQQFDADDPETGNLFEAFVRGLNRVPVPPIAGGATVGPTARRRPASLHCGR